MGAAAIFSSVLPYFVALGSSVVAGNVESESKHSSDLKRTQQLHSDFADTDKRNAETQKAAIDDDDIDKEAPTRPPPKDSEPGYIYVALTVLGACFSLAAMQGKFDDIFPGPGKTRVGKKTEKKEKETEKKEKKEKKEKTEKKEKKAN